MKQVPGDVEIAIHTQVVSPHLASSILMSKLFLLGKSDPAELVRVLEEEDPLEVR